MALTIKFEKAVQAVAPHVTVPYWDFTIDAEEIFLNKDKDLSSYWFQGSVRLYIYMPMHRHTVQARSLEPHPSMPGSHVWAAF